MISPENAIAGRNPVREALRANRPINKLLLAKGAGGKALSEIFRLAREKQIPLQQVERSFLDKLFPGTVHQGIVALASAKEYSSLDEILNCSDQEDPFLILLDGVTDPHNLGAVLRVADAVGVHGVVIERHRSASLTPAVLKAAAGAAEYVPVARVTNLAQTIQHLKQKGIWIAGADLSGRDIFGDIRLSGPLALVIGGEDKGLGKLVRDKCDWLVRVPMVGRVGSLNASVAAAVIAYEVFRQRRLANRGRISGC